MGLYPFFGLVRSLICSTAFLRLLSDGVVRHILTHGFPRISTLRRVNPRKFNLLLGSARFTILVFSWLTIRSILCSSRLSIQDLTRSVMYLAMTTKSSAYLTNVAFAHVPGPWAPWNALSNQCM